MGHRVVTRLGYLSVRSFLNKTPKKAQTPVPIIRYINWVKSTRLRSTDKRCSLHCSKTAPHTALHVWSDKSLITGHLGLLFQLGPSTSLAQKQFHTTSRCFDYDQRVLNLRRDLKDVYQQVKDKKNPAESATKECKNLIKSFHKNTAIPTTFSKLSKRKRLILDMPPELIKEDRNKNVLHTLDYWHNYEDNGNVRDCVLPRDAPEVVKVEATVEKMKEANPETQIYPFDIHVLDHECFRWAALSTSEGSIFISKFEVNEFTDNELAFVVGHEMGHVMLQHSTENVCNKLFFQESAVHSAFVIQECCVIDQTAKEPIIYVQEIIETVGNLIPGVLGDRGRHEFEADMSGAYFCYKAQYDPQDFIDRLLQDRYDNTGALSIKPPKDLRPKLEKPSDEKDTDDIKKLSLNADLEKTISTLYTDMEHPPNRERGEALQIYYDRLRKPWSKLFDWLA